ncbi:MAG: PEP-utilizing enzyme [archaeon]
MNKYILMWADENQNYYDLNGILLNYGPRLKERFGFGISQALVWGNGFNAEFYVQEEELKKAENEGYEFFRSTTKFKKFEKEVKTAYSSIVTQMQKLAEQDFKEISNEELSNLLDTFGRGIKECFISYIATQPHNISKIEKKLRDLLTSQGIKDIDGIIIALTTPKKRFIINEKNNPFLKSFAESIKSEEAKIDKNLNKKVLFKEEDADQKERMSLIQNSEIPGEAVLISDILRNITEQRFRMRLIWMQALYYNELILEEIKTRLKISKEELRLCNYQEIAKMLETGKKIEKSILQERKESSIFILKNNEINILEGNKAKEIKESLSVKLDLKELKGAIANKGKVKGKVIVLSYRNADNHLEKIKNMQEGDVLVSEMTRPNIITACKKASAIITDEGGITCHAAIVARELRKPCIIGTKIATQVLKDGQEVEVDANTGVIKIL